MRYSASEKLEIIHIVERSHLPARQTLEKLGIPRATFYRWYDLYQSHGFEGLYDKKPLPSHSWNRIPDEIRDQVLDLALQEPELSPRELSAYFMDYKAYFISEASIYRILKANNMITSPAYVVIKAADRFKDQPSKPNEQWQTDFTYFKIQGWGWYYLSTILDDYSRYIVSWKLCSTMTAQDVIETLRLAFKTSHINSNKTKIMPRLLSDNGASYIASDLAAFLKENNMKHVRGKPYHPQTQGKIERWHQTLKNKILLDHYHFPSHLENEIGKFIHHYNHERYHESLGNITPADAYAGRSNEILQQRKQLKLHTLTSRRLHHASNYAIQ